jgi:hypothetical protein
VPKNESSIDRSGGSQGRIGPRSQTSANDEVKRNMEKGPEGLAAEQNKDQGVKIETRIEVGTSLQQTPNWIVQFPKSDRSISLDSEHMRTSRTTATRVAATPHWFPLGLTTI